MKLKVYFYLLFLLVFSWKIQAQEEFFGKQAGLSLTASRVFKTLETSGGLSFHSKKGFLLGTSFSNESFGAYTGLIIEALSETNFPTKPFLVLEYGKSEEIKMTSFHFGMTQCLFNHSNFPSSVSAGLFLLRAKGSENYAGYTQTLIDNGFSASFSQLFFKQNPVSPFVAIAYTWTGEGDAKSIHAGINITLSTKNTQNSN